MSDNKFSGDNVELSINIDGEWKPLKHVDMGFDEGREDQSVVSVLTAKGDNTTLDDEKTKAFLEEQQQFHIDEAHRFLSREAVRNLSRAMDILGFSAVETGGMLHEQYEELLKKRKDYKVAIMAGRQLGKSESHRRLLQILEHEIGNPTPPDQNSAFSFKPRHCYCLKCRMGQSHQCMTFSPKKRRGK